MNAWETEDEYAAAAQASLPTPNDTPYRTPSHSSRRSSRKKSISPAPSSSPPPMPLGDRSRRESRDVANDESISILDPRRFTPTLHANLVSEILALRRDQEEKAKTIEILESELHETRGEHESLEASLATIEKEGRSLKRQLALLEGGTSSALSELARERDEAVDTITETRKRLDAAQKKIRSQEEDANRVHELWERDRDNWEEEKRKYERKVHVAEGRLKVVLEEVAAYQASNENGQQDSEAEYATKEAAHGPSSDAGSIRTMSMTNSIRFSLLNGPNGYGPAKTNGVSLADELDLDDEEETDYDGRESAVLVRHMRNQSRESMMSRTHRRNQSNESIMRPGSVARGRLLANQVVLDRLRGGIIEDDETTPEAKIEVEYVDTGIQYSPPTSPKLAPIEDLSVNVPASVNEATENANQKKQPPIEHPAREWEIEANQRRKRVHAHPPLVIEPVTSYGTMVSAASQTLDDPLSPPRTPISPTRAPPPPPILLPEKLPEQDMISISTQTDIPEIPSRRAAPPPIPIPSIQLHPPSSAPTTPRAHTPILPQHSKDVGCQVSMPLSLSSRSVSMQTEEIRVDQRINFLPPHLQPSAIVSLPPSPEPAEENRRFSPVPGNLPPRNPRRVKTPVEHEIPSSPPIPETRDAYPGNNDDGPLAKDKGPIRRPHRVSSLFAGFDNASSDDNDDFDDADLSENDFRTALSAPKPVPHKAGKRASAGPTSVPEDAELSGVARPVPPKNPMRRSVDNDSLGDYSFPEVQSLPQRALMKTIRQLDKPLSVVTTATTAKAGTMRRAALIQSGVAAHQGRSQSPIFPEPTKEPPFPIPTRASSRRPPVSSSAPSDGRASPSLGRGPGRGHYRASSVRKVRSAAAIPRTGRTTYRRNGSRSPPPMSPSTEAPESPRLPPMPNNEITTPRHSKDTASSRYRSHRQQPSTTNTANTTNTVNTTNTTNTGSGSVSGTNNATSVVDAIAQTMVGEWMFKYVRRRKSFGVSETNIDESNGNVNGNGVRHKRWVWLAPYERAVMWSSKQPTSGSALLGKSGRKLTIQSVLDVKDDNPSPRGMPQIFNRSILILTPARALKFTATSQERHYLWLTALSFLAHSSQEVPDIVSPQPQPQQVRPQLPDFEMPRQPMRLRRGGIRDSIRVAKGKTAVARPGPTSIHSSQPGETDPSVSIRDSESFFTSHTDPIAEPPFVPRFTERGQSYNHGPPLSHGRKRSNTGSRIPPPLSFRGFSGGGHAPQSSTAGLSVSTTAGSSDIYQSQASSAGGYPSGRSSIRTSDASGRPGAVVNNFFDAVGTMRMEAFISPMASIGRFDDYPDEMEERQMDLIGMNRRRSRERRRRSRNRDTYYGGRHMGKSGSDDWYGGSKTAGEEDYGHFDGGYGRERDDPFKGF